MPDREKVIAWLADEEQYYRDHGDTHNSLMACYALALLKEQEAVEPILKRSGRSKAFNDYVCPVCDQEIAYEQNYCSECGKPILWKGGE